MTTRNKWLLLIGGLTLVFISIIFSVVKIRNYSDELIDKSFAYNTNISKTELEPEPEPEITREERLKNFIQIATWYDYDLNREDQKCRSDDCYSMFNDTCASRDYPRGTYLLVEMFEPIDGYYVGVTCRVNDYGPAESTGKNLDLSSHAFRQLAPLAEGNLKVLIHSTGL